MPDTHDERGGDEAAALLAIRRRALTAATYAEWLQVGRDIETLGQKLAAATARAEKAERQMYLIIGAVEHAYALNAYVELEPGETAPTVESLWAEVREIRGVAPDAAPDGRSATGTDDGASGGAFHGNTSSITPQGLSEAEGGCPWCGTLQKLDADGLVLPHEHPTYCDECPGSTRRPNNDTTEDGQHG